MGSTIERYLRLESWDPVALEGGHSSHLVLLGAISVLLFNHPFCLESYPSHFTQVTLIGCLSVLKLFTGNLWVDSLQEW